MRFICLICIQFRGELEIFIIDRHDHCACADNFKITAQEKGCQRNKHGPSSPNRMFCYTQPIFCKHNFKFQNTTWNKINHRCEYTVQLTVEWKHFIPMAYPGLRPHILMITVCSPDRKRAYSTLKGIHKSFQIGHQTAAVNWW